MSVFGVKGFAKIGIIGGTGLDDPDLLTERKEVTVITPYGKPSDVLICGKMSGVDCVLIARHGRKHDISPTNVNYRANIWALKEAGCSHLIVSTACGSLKEEIHPGEFVILDSFIDRTTKRILTFYDGNDALPTNGILHMPMHEPFCSHTRNILIETIKELNIPFHATGTCVTIEGPRYSSKAESNIFRSWNADVVNMTTVPEVVLAKEAGLCYAAIAMATDYDCWRDRGENVSTQAVKETFRKNVDNVKKIFQVAVGKVAAYEKWPTVIEGLHASISSNKM